MNTFEAFRQMNAKDIENEATGIGDALIQMGIDMLSAEYKHKKGLEVKIGIAGNAKDILDLESGKKCAILLIYNQDEYLKLMKEK